MWIRGTRCYTGRCAEKARFYKRKSIRTGGFCGREERGNYGGVGESEGEPLSLSPTPANFMACVSIFLGLKTFLGGAEGGRCCHP